MGKQMEYEKFKECSFRPKTVTATTEEDRQKVYEGSVSEQVRGMEQFMRKKEYEKKILKDKETREKEVFGFAEKYDKTKGRQKKTIPEPFNLSRAPKKFH